MINNKIIRKSLAEEVAAGLHEQISNGTYKLDQKLPIEPELMKIFGVGRSTLREALRILENSGIINVRHGVGAFVISQTSKTTSLVTQILNASHADVREVRDLLELKIVEKAALNRTDVDIAAIRSFLEKRNNAADDKDFSAWMEADVNFHIAIAEASKNSILTDLYKTFAEQQLVRFISANVETPNVMHRFTAIHNNLLECIIENNPKNAKALIEKMNRTI